ncbi:histone-fold-containing protein [Mycena alexandri]|uniref:Histone-fold-containing protein n=1 Tax=Mycena alexandri TaxID=1745969 RepID=A0AAD6SKT0_9AGAR|nr:histone-fold-containing protein [Mycena alexandri]
MANLHRLVPTARIATNEPQPTSEQPAISDHDIGEYREQDRFLPVCLQPPLFHRKPFTRVQIANVSRIMKAAVPSNTKIGKDAKECVQECVSEFISFISSEAAEHSFNEKRKTIGGEDILHAMSNLGFDNYAEVLKIYLAKHREHQTTMASARAEQYHIDPAADEL